MSLQTVDLPMTENIKIHIDEPSAINNLSDTFTRFLQECGITGYDEVILLCIGTDRSTGDCFGPLVGSKINSLSQDFFKVYGTLDQPVHASNLNEKLREIYNRHHNPFIIAVDASLGKLESVGSINMGNGSLQPGAGVNKNLPPIGNIFITGIVNVGGFMEYLVLQNTRLNIVMRMADKVVEGLMESIPCFTTEATTV